VIAATPTARLGVAVPRVGARLGALVNGTSGVQKVASIIGIISARTARA